MSSKFLRTMDAAERLGCSTERVRQLEREGKLHPERTPSGQRIFFVDEVDRLATERQQAKVHSMGDGE